MDAFRANSPIYFNAFKNLTAVSLNKAFAQNWVRIDWLKKDNDTKAINSDSDTRGETSECQV